MKKVIVALVILLVIASCVFSCRISFMLGQNNGYLQALDTINAMMKAQAFSDTTVTDLTLVHRDTSRYFLSKKSIKR